MFHVEHTFTKIPCYKEQGPDALSLRPILFPDGFPPPRFVELAIKFEELFRDHGKRAALDLYHRFRKREIDGITSNGSRGTTPTTESSSTHFITEVRVVQTERIFGVSPRSRNIFLKCI